MTTEQERAAFEAHFSKPPFEWEFHRHVEDSAWPGNYQRYEHQCAWEAWQARAALQSQPKANDMMLSGVLRMPFDMAMASELSRMQFYQRAQQALDELEALQSQDREDALVQAIQEASGWDMKDYARAAVAQQQSAQGSPKRRPYNTSGSLSEYGVFPECDAAPATAQAQPIMPPLTDAMRAVLRNDRDAYGSEDDLYSALVAAAQARLSESPASSSDVVNDALDNLLHDNYEHSHSGSKNREADAAIIRAALANVQAQPVTSKQLTTDLERLSREVHGYKVKLEKWLTKMEETNWAVTGSGGPDDIMLRDMNHTACRLRDLARKIPALTSPAQNPHVEFGPLAQAWQWGFDGVTDGLICSLPRDIFKVAYEEGQQARAALAQDGGRDQALADTQRQMIEAAERRGYERAEAENVGYRTDAERYRWLKENIELGYELPGGYYIPDEDTDTWDKTIDSARAAKGE